MKIRSLYWFSVFGESQKGRLLRDGKHLKMKKTLSMTPLEHELDIP